MIMPLWEYFREPYEYESVGRTMIFYRDGIRRADGFEILKLVSVDDDRFWCRGNFGEFRFIARRRDNRESEPSERYTVYPDEFDTKWPGDREKNRELCLAHLKDIESALLHFPTVFYFDYMPEAPYSVFNEEDSQSPTGTEVSQVAKTIKGLLDRLNFRKP